MSNYTESEYFKTSDGRKRPAGSSSLSQVQLKPKVYEPVSREATEYIKEMLSKRNTRSFGKELQVKTLSELQKNNGNLLSFYKKPNPNERLWNPSPSKKPRSNKEYSDDNVKERLKKLSSVTVKREEPPSWGDDDDGDKENTTSRYFPPKPDCPVIIPYTKNQETSRSSDLNNSFTEKISNLEIGNLNDSITSTPPPPTPSPTTSLIISPSPQENECTLNNQSVDNWVETLDPDYAYITEILNYWHTLEVSHKVNPNYMGKQKEISFKMRTILVDWLVEVVEEYQIGEATLHRCIQFVDRFLSKLQISRSNLQLLGTTCLFIACKVEEIHPPDTGDLIYITDNTYTKPQLLKMECLVLSVLDFDLLTPTPHEFTEYFSNTLQLSPTSKRCSHYIIELTLLYGEKFLRYSGSVIALAACYVSIRCCGDTQMNSSSNKPENKGTLSEVLGRVKRLNPTTEYKKIIEQVVSDVYFTLLSVSSTTSTQSNNSVCTKYKQFQDQKFLVAVASSAACSSLWLHFT